jgi:hypothetical protein
LLIKLQGYLFDVSMGGFSCLIVAAKTDKTLIVQINSTPLQGSKSHIAPFQIEVFGLGSTFERHQPGI